LNTPHKSLRSVWGVFVMCKQVRFVIWYQNLLYRNIFA